MPAKILSCSVRHSSIVALCLSASFGLAQAQTSVTKDDLAGPDFDPNGVLYYKNGGEQTAGSYRFDRDENKIGYLNLTVRPQCPPEKSNCSERAEIWEKPGAHLPYLQGGWYGFSVRFGEPIPQDDSRYVFAQWKREIPAGSASDFSPLLALRLQRGKLYATIETDTVSSHLPPCASHETIVKEDDHGTQIRGLLATSADWTAKDQTAYDHCSGDFQISQYQALPAPQSGWIDFVVYSRPGPSGDGRILLFANDIPIAQAKGRIGHALGAEAQYFKFGPYRNAGQSEWSLDFRSFRRGTKCIEVASEPLCQTVPGL